LVERCRRCKKGGNLAVNREAQSGKAPIIPRQDEKKSLRGGAALGKAATQLKKITEKKTFDCVEENSLKGDFEKGSDSFEGDQLSSTEGSLRTEGRHRANAQELLTEGEGRNEFQERTRQLQALSPRKRRVFSFWAKRGSLRREKKRREPRMGQKGCE